MTDGHDRFGLLDRRRTKITFGFTDVSGALRAGEYRGTLEDRDSMTLRLDPALLPPDPVDYFGPLHSEFRGTAGTGRPREFVGHAATAAEASDGLLDIEAFGATLLTERLIGYFAAKDVTPHEITYVMARSAGMSDDQLSIPDLDELPTETFEVVAPIYGVTVSEATDLANVTVVPVDRARGTLGELEFDLDELEPADAYAVSLQTESLGFHAERNGLDAIDLAIDWLATRLRYGLAVLPDGTAQPFDRESCRALVRRGDLVAVRGLQTQRRWLRSASMDARASSIELDPDDPLLGTLPQQLTAADRLALASCRRAVSEREPLERVQALWEAIEYLVAGYRAPKLFAQTELDDLKAALPDNISRALRERAEKAISELNQPPLMARLRSLIESAALPCSDAEVDLLVELRRIRNRAAHGRVAEPPAPDVLDYATAIACRLVTAKLWGEARAADTRARSFPPRHRE